LKLAILPRRSRWPTPDSTGAPPDGEPGNVAMAVANEFQKDDVDVPMELMLATLTDRRDFAEDWLLERKFDGERCVAIKT